MWNKPHQYRGYICPHCGARANFANRSLRLVKFLFWYIEVPQHAWIAYCDDWCDDFMADRVYTVSPSLRARKREWHRYYDEKTAGLPDYPILAYAKYGKDIK